MAYIDDVMKAYPQWPRHIRHGEFTGVLCGVQPLLEGRTAPIYRFPGGECVGVDYETTAVRISVKEDVHGLTCCGSCGTALLCIERDICPVCHEGIKWP